MKTIMTALPMIALYLSLVCGRRFGPTDSTAFVMNAALQFMLIAFMLRSMLRWRNARNMKRMSVALTSIGLSVAAAYHPSTSPRSFADFRGMAVNHGASVTAPRPSDLRPDVTGTPDELQALEKPLGRANALSRRKATAARVSPLASLRWDKLPIVD